MRVRILIAVLLVTSAGCNLYFAEPPAPDDDDDIIDFPDAMGPFADASQLPACTYGPDGTCGECFVQAPPGDPATVCQIDVCDVDPSCCAVDWDESCVRKADQFCGRCVDAVTFGGEGAFTAAYEDNPWSSFSRAIADGTVAIAWGDYDGDGDADVAATGECSVRVLRNEGWASGAVQFTQVFSLAPGGCTPAFGGRRALWTDLDHDGVLDAVYVGASGVRWARGVAGGVVDGGTIVPPTVGVPTDVVPVDLDGDLRLDLVVGFADAPARIYRQSMPRTFTLDTTWQGQVDGVSAATECHIGNGETIALAGDTGVEVYTRGVNGTMVPMMIPGIGTAIDIACTRVGSIADDALVLLRSDHTIRVATSFAVLWDSATAQPPRYYDGTGIAVGDLNGDDRFDLVVAPAADDAPFVIMYGGGPDASYWPVDAIDPAPGAPSAGAAFVHLGREIKL